MSSDTTWLDKIRTKIAAGQMDDAYDWCFALHPEDAAALQEEVMDAIKDGKLVQNDKAKVWPESMCTIGDVEVMPSMSVAKGDIRMLRKRRPTCS